MHTLARILALGVALLLVGTLGLALQPAKASMDRPTWSAGNFWEYAVFAGSGVPSGNVTFRMDVTGTDSVTLNGTAYPCYHVKSDFKLPIGGGLTFEVFPEIWFSVDTLAIVKISAVIPPIGNLTTQTTVVIAGSPPETIQWPLTAGASWGPSSTVVWTSSTNATRTTWSHTTLSRTFQVQSDATITVPVGTFTTTPLKETNASGSYTMNFWSAQVGNWARVGSYNSSGGNTQNFNLTSYSYGGGGGFSITSILLGLPVWIWLILLVVIVVAIIGFFAVRRRKPPVMMPPAMPPQEPPMGP